MHSNEAAMLHLANLYTLYDPESKKVRGFKGNVRVTWYNADIDIGIPLYI